MKIHEKSFVFYCEQKLLDWKLVYIYMCAIPFLRCSSFIAMTVLLLLYSSQDEYGWMRMGAVEKKKKKSGEKLADETFIIKFFDFCIGFVHTVLLFKATLDWYLKLKKKTRAGMNKWTHSHTRVHKRAHIHTQNLLKTGYYTMNRQAKQNESKCN